MKTPTKHQLIRLDRISGHLRLSSYWGEPEFEDEAVAACLKHVKPILNKITDKTGEAVIDALATHFSVQFEEVHSTSDIEYLEQKYLKKKREIGFAQLRNELKDPSVDALLFQRTQAHESDHDRWVAVLNLQESSNRAFWNRIHELSHRVAEPPQMVLPFRRHKLEASNPIEKLIDRIASELAFYPPFFKPLVKKAAKQGNLTIETIENLQSIYAPTASLLSVANAVVKYWPVPAIVLTAKIKGRKHKPEKDRALRVEPQGRNSLSYNAGLHVYPNMRAPITSPIYDSHCNHRPVKGFESLLSWTTSSGDSLQNVNVFTSAVNLGAITYAVISA